CWGPCECPRRQKTWVDPLIGTPLLSQKVCRPPGGHLPHLIRTTQMNGKMLLQIVEASRGRFPTMSRWICGEPLPIRSKAAPMGIFVWTRGIFTHGGGQADCSAMKLT